MNYIDSTYTDTLEVKQSKFIAFLTPFSQYEKTLTELKQEHPKARHFVVAYRHLNEYEQIVEYSSDDGEPKGTSGRPSLFVLQGAQLINTAVIVVRYFGGTKLGPGGLVRAYSDVINLSLLKAKLLEYKKEEEIEIQFEYSNIRMVEYECDELNIEIIQKSFDNQTLYKIKGSKESIDLFLKKMNRLVEVI
ncbi:MAG: YigZ family protein [Sulfurimonas sp.]|uniref:IMPACT family protein n=1 Tax=Sulfurimonas sp. TaxID=2022749 RepID=UPI0025F080D6|nr:YigZ family protein [Sulfurimonas sp.]MCK9491038.1 YigZ family protein [Sulfurimonas sp.]